MHMLIFLMGGSSWVLSSAAGLIERIYPRLVTVIEAVCGRVCVCVRAGESVSVCEMNLGALGFYGMNTRKMKR